MGLAWLPTLLYMILGIFLATAGTKDNLEKIMWVVGFIFIPLVTAFVFYFTFRKKQMLQNRNT